MKTSGVKSADIKAFQAELKAEAKPQTKPDRQIEPATVNEMREALAGENRSKTKRPTYCS